MSSFRTASTLLSFMLCCYAYPVKAQDIQPGDEQLRLNQIQVIGTHNSYHLAPVPNVMDLIALSGAETARGIDYTHEPLPKQFSEYGIRQIELDLFADPEGGLYSTPSAWKMVGGPVEDPRMKFDFAEVMRRPGFKIIHAPGFDYATHVPTLEQALEQVVLWSESHPGHLPILVLLELKDSAPPLAGV
ncbi:MAG: Ca2+-dependent phosphoinositide-specific phospholipase C, partial [Planctomycetota bacterium]